MKRSVLFLLVLIGCDRDPVAPPVDQRVLPNQNPQPTTKPIKLTRPRSEVVFQPKPSSSLPGPGSLEPLAGIDPPEPLPPVSTAALNAEPLPTQKPVREGSYLDPKEVAARIEAHRAKLKGTRPNQHQKERAGNTGKKASDKKSGGDGAKEVTRQATVIQQPTGGGFLQGLPNPNRDNVFKPTQFISARLQQNILVSRSQAGVVFAALLEGGREIGQARGTARVGLDRRVQVAFDTVYLYDGREFSGQLEGFDMDHLPGLHGHVVDRGWRYAGLALADALLATVSLGAETNNLLDLVKINLGKDLAEDAQTNLQQMRQQTFLFVERDTQFWLTPSQKTTVPDSIKPNWKLDPYFQQFDDLYSKKNQP